MANLLGLFQDLIPKTPLLVGTVQSSDGDTHQVTLLDGGRMVVRGTANPGSKVFIRGDMIQGQAPNLTEEVIEI